MKPEKRTGPWHRETGPSRRSGKPRASKLVGATTGCDLAALVTPGACVCGNWLLAARIRRMVLDGQGLVDVGGRSVDMEASRCYLAALPTRANRGTTRTAICCRCLLGVDASLVVSFSYSLATNRWICDQSSSECGPRSRQDERFDVRSRDQKMKKNRG